MSEQNNTLPVDALEMIYDELASAIDEVDKEATALFLVKLVLLNAKTIGSAETLREHIRIAKQDF
ncbi:DUF2783 domain-containing protein [Advenella alkanexedens]|uniref:DUF2783 domain-containing protein n=1 Tax=Advenella alkanexedens TaxID=1481665 RepID=A0ABS6NRA2_9BURK|nr:DUF2783 domain-containing protein [Advenella alkanexedens]MBV4397736.1 DUF2783 domain-containing protein [Advenella alkanexedens]